MYAKLITGKSISPTQTQQKWVVDCDTKDDECIKWPETYQLASKCSTSTRLVEFQFKLLHRRLSTIDFLAKIGVQNDPHCFCLLLARHYKWTCKNKKTSPKIEGFLQYLKSIYLCEEKAGATLPKKWELLKTLTQ